MLFPPAKTVIHAPVVFDGSAAGRDGDKGGSQALPARVVAVAEMMTLVSFRDEKRLPFLLLWMMGWDHAPDNS